MTTLFPPCFPIAVMPVDVNSGKEGSSSGLAARPQLILGRNLNAVVINWQNTVFIHFSMITDRNISMINHDPFAVATEVLIKASKRRGMLALVDTSTLLYPGSLLIG